MDAEGLIAVGGACTTVAMGGYYLGGGHSPLTRSFGLAVDNVMGISMITLDGRHIYIDFKGN